MARNKSYKNAKDKREGGSFVPLPHSVLNSVAYLSLDAYGKTLLMDLLAQYKGSNNGDLSAPFSTMHPRGWKSEATLNKAKKALIESKLVVETRKGQRPNKCSLFALTFYALDESPKLDMTAKSFPRGAYKLLEPLPNIQPKTKSL